MGVPGVHRAPRRGVPRRPPALHRLRVVRRRVAPVSRRGLQNVSLPRSRGRQFCDSRGGVQPRPRPPGVGRPPTRVGRPPWAGVVLRGGRPRPQPLRGIVTVVGGAAPSTHGAVGGGLRRQRRVQLRRVAETGARGGLVAHLDVLQLIVDRLSCGKQTLYIRNEACAVALSFEAEHSGATLARADGTTFLATALHCACASRDGDLARDARATNEREHSMKISRAKQYSLSRVKRPSQLLFHYCTCDTSDFNTNFAQINNVA